MSLLVDRVIILSEIAQVTYIAPLIVILCGSQVDNGVVITVLSP